MAAIRGKSNLLEAQKLWTQARQPIAIVGPTATGKTDAALELAERIGGEIVNADSVQVYRGLDIGAAKPDREAQARVRFHLLDVADPDQQFTVSDWKTQAEAAIEDIFERGKQPIVCGGTGLYIRALVEDWSLAATPGDSQVRRELEAERKAQGIENLYARLQTVDPETAARLHPNDALRIIRALEVYQVTKTPLSVYQAEDRRTRPHRPIRRFGLTLPREVLIRAHRKARRCHDCGRIYRRSAPINPSRLYARFKRDEQSGLQRDLRVPDGQNTNWKPLSKRSNSTRAVSPNASSPGFAPTSNCSGWTSAGQNAAEVAAAIQSEL